MAFHQHKAAALHLQTSHHRERGVAGLLYDGVAGKIKVRMQQVLSVTQLKIIYVHINISGYTERRDHLEASISVAVCIVLLNEVH